jgi:CRISPR-associated protein Csm2
MKYPDQKLDPQWITHEGKIDNDVIEWLESFGKFLAVSSVSEAQPITTTQIRKFFGEVKKIQADFTNKKSEVIMLAPKLAYAVGRDDFNSNLNRKKTKIVEFQKEVDKAIKAVNDNKENYDRFVSILEGIVAYHKYAGGKN